MFNLIIVIIVGVLCYKEGMKAGKKHYEKIVEKKLMEDYVVVRKEKATTDNSLMDKILDRD
jgi:hypothetical protein